MALGEAEPGFIGHQLAVINVGGVNRDCDTGGSAARGKKQIGAADDFGNTHGGIVDHDCELVTWKIVMTPNDEVAKVFTGDKCLRATRCVRKGNWLAIRKRESAT
jgi:hypothetical protein